MEKNLTEEIQKKDAKNLENRLQDESQKQEKRLADDRLQKEKLQKENRLKNDRLQKSKDTQKKLREMAKRKTNFAKYKKKEIVKQNQQPIFREAFAKDTIRQEPTKGDYEDTKARKNTNKKFEAHREKIRELEKQKELQKQEKKEDKKQKTYTK